MASQNFEGVFWHVQVTHSNRFGTKIKFTSVGSDGCFLVPESRTDSTLQRLKSGENPDLIAQSFPIDEPLPK